MSGRCAWRGGGQGTELHTKGNTPAPKETSGCPASTCGRTATKLHAEIGKTVAEEGHKK